MEKGRASVRMGGERKRRPGSGEESRRGSECMEAAGEEEDERPRAGGCEQGSERGGRWGGREGPDLTDSLWQEIANTFILWQRLDIELELVLSSVL